MKKLVCLLALACSVCLVSRAAPAQASSASTSKIRTSFVVLGDCRLGEDEAAPGDTSSANVAQLRRSLLDIAKLRPKPTFIFFTGDLVQNEANDHGQALATQLKAWTKLYRRVARECGLKVPLIPIPGNHELMRIVVKNGKPVEEINPYTYSVWLKWLRRSRLGHFSGNGPTAAAPNPDRLAGNNRRFTYSFDDDAGDHFIIINTYTLSDRSPPPSGWIPYHWIAADARKAEANPHVHHIFAFGHMPIRIQGLPFDAQGAYSILNTATDPLAQELQQTFGSLPKFGAYFCGHVHIWSCGRLPGSNSVWQVIAGNGGSKLIEKRAGPWKEPYYFGFTVVRIHRDGQVGIVSYQRPVPHPFYSTAPQPPAEPQPEIILGRNGAPATQSR